MRKGRDLNPEYYLKLLGQFALDLLGRSGEAEVYFVRALEVAPLFFTTRLAYAVHLHRMGRFDEAEAAYEHARSGHAPGDDWRVTHSYWYELKARLEEDRAAAEEKEGQQGPL